MGLRDYQQDCLDKIREAKRKGINKQLCVSPTASGKTVIFSHLPDALGLQPGEQMMVCAHRKELCDQTAEKLRRYNPDLKVSVERAEERADTNADLIVASVPTIGKAKRREADNGNLIASPDDSDLKWEFCSRLRKFDPERVRHCVIDEFHHCPAGSTYHNVLRYFRLFKPEPEYDDRSKTLIGFTATPNRSDSIGMDAIVDEIVFQREIREMVKAGWLERIHAYMVHTETNISEVATRQGDFVPSQLEKVINSPERNRLIVSEYQKRGEGMQAFAFTVDVQHSIDLAQAFNDAGIPAAAISGDTPPDLRAAYFQAFRDYELQILVSCQVLLEGTDVPQASVGLMCRPTKSGLMYTQSIGRLLRPYPAPEELARWVGWIKPYAIILDFVDVCGRHRLNTIPTLFGLRPDFDARGKDVVETVEEVEQLTTKARGVDPALFTDLTSLRAMVESVDLLATPTVPEALRGVSPFTWMTGPTGGYVLILPEKASYSVKQNLLGQWEASRSANGVRYPMGKFRSLDAAVRDIDQRVPPDVQVILKSDAGWRREAPSDKQVGLLWKVDRELRQRIPTYEQFSAFVKATYTRGDVSNRINHNWRRVR